MKYFIYLCLATLIFSCDKTEDKAYHSIAELKEVYSSGDKDNWPKPTVDSMVVDFQDIGVLPDIKFDKENEFSEKKRELGKSLFYDPRLSSSGQIACATCHDPNIGWADGKRVPFGHDRSPGSRNTLSIINIGHLDTFFWDGRAANLAEQAKAAIENPIEMNHDMDSVVMTIQNIAGYKPYFEEVYGDDKISEDQILDAIITFERTIVSRKSRFDKFIAGDSTKLSNQEVQGLHLFRTKARCINCHNSALFTDQQFHNLGLSYYGRKYEDLGRYAVTNAAADVGKFKTPSLRELKHTAPYMHNGLFPHLEGVLNMYNAGMATLKPSKKQETDPLFPTKSKLLKELDLDQNELEALEAFLNSLSSTIYRERPPERLPQ
ncbi:MAG: hypothetical protein L0J49_01915 [Lactococcus lactis]|nr:hypothetical protein [Lactococcus lactis]